MTRMIALFAVVTLACGGRGGGDKAGSGSSAAAGDPLAGLHASADLVLAALGQREIAKDVTCWTSFRQLDWFIAEKSYSEFGTLAKIAAMKALVRATWQKASAAAKGPQVTAADVEAAAKLPKIALSKPVQQGLPAFANDIGIKNYTDYQKTAEHERMTLAVIEDEMYYTGGKPRLKPLDATGVRALSDAATTLSLMLLKASSKAADAATSTVIEGPHVQQAHREIAAQLGLQNEPYPRAPLGVDQIAAHLRPLTKQLIDHKVEALRKFNKASGNPVTDLNKVLRMPLTEDGLVAMMRDVQSFVHFVARGLEPMRADNYLSDGSFAKSRLPVRGYIDEVWVQNVVMQVFPHEILASGDTVVRFEPNPGPVTDQKLAAFEIKLLDHEMNGVRDSGIHWIALQNVWNEYQFAMDPFAAEYVSEVASIMQTLWIRRGEQMARELGKRAIDGEVIAAIRARDKSYVKVPPHEASPAAWTDARKQQKQALVASLKLPLFVDTSKTAGLPTRFERFHADLAGVTGHVAPDTKDVKGHVEPDTKDVKGHVEPDTKDVKGHVEPVQGHFNLQTIMGAGIAVGDVDGDDYPDVYLAGEELGRLYLNRGKRAPGKFVDATARYGLPLDLHDGHGTLLFDYDGDGDLDLLVLRSAHPSALFRQDQGKLVDVAPQLGLVTHRGAHVAHVFDYDRDGDLDVYIGYYGSKAANDSGGRARSVPALDGRNGSPNQLWRNDGAKFTEVAARAKVDDIGWTLALGSFDGDGDGDLDLYLANDFGANTFYRNNGDGTFADITDATETGDRGSGMNVDVSDLNGDGKWDVYVTNIDMFSKNIKVVFPRDESTINIDDQLTRAFQYISGNKLYVSSGAGYRPEENLRFEPHDRGWGWDAGFFDYENDGDDDLYLTNGWINGSYAGNQKNQMYLNQDGFLFLAPDGSPEAFPGNTRSAAAVDLDRDGDLDLVVNNFRQPPRVLINNQRAGNRYVQVRLAGKGKNTRALGATVTVIAGDKKILRQVSGGRGYLSQADTVVTAGVGSAKTVEVVVRWPDGSETRRAGLATNQRHVIER